MLDRHSAAMEIVGTAGCDGLTMLAMVICPPNDVERASRSMRKARSAIVTLDELLAGG